MADAPSTPQPHEGLPPDLVPSVQPDSPGSPDGPGSPDSIDSIDSEQPDSGLDVTAPAAPPLADPTERTRISGAWVGVIIAALVLTLLLVFILQNTKSVKISYFTAIVTMPIGVALLLATIGGVLFAGVVASLRIWQLRRRMNDPAFSSGKRTSHRLRRPATVEGPPRPVDP
jgi:uncharacterized integral membrane protein